MRDEKTALLRFIPYWFVGINGTSASMRLSYASSLIPHPSPLLKAEDFRRYRHALFV
jgi:hypothetical protein